LSQVAKIYNRVADTGNHGARPISRGQLDPLHGPDHGRCQEHRRQVVWWTLARYAQPITSICAALIDDVVHWMLKALGHERMLEVHDYEGPVPRDLGAVTRDAVLTNGHDDGESTGDQPTDHVSTQQGDPRDGNHHSVWIMYAITAAVIAAGKDRNAVGWFLLGLIFGVFRDHGCLPAVPAPRAR
jgi:hypothetical protein